MHEASLVSSLLRQVHDIAFQNNATSIIEIRVEIGPLAGVESLLFSEAYDRLKADTLAADAVLRIDFVSLTCCCRTCQLKHETDELQFKCPACSSRDIDVTGGDSVVLHSVALNCKEEAETSQ